MADVTAAHALSLAMSRERLRQARAALFRSDCAIGAMRVGPVTAGVGTVGVIMLTGWGFRGGASLAAKDGAAVEAVTKSVSARLSSGMPRLVSPRRARPTAPSHHLGLHVVSGHRAGALSTPDR